MHMQTIYSWHCIFRLHSVRIICGMHFTYYLVNIVRPKSPTDTIAHSLQGSSHRGSFAGSQCDFEISMQRQPSKGSRHTTLRMPMRANSLSRWHDESCEANASYSDSVRSGIIRIPRIPPSSETTGSIATLVGSVDKHNTSKTVIEHHPDVCPPVSNMDYTDNAYSSPFNPTISLSTNSKVSETVSECIGDFTTNEKELQLYLKRERLPYRVMRRNVETDLEAGLQTYFELDVLDENNKFICDNCTAKRMEERGTCFDIGSRKFWQIMPKFTLLDLHL